MALGTDAGWRMEISPGGAGVTGEFESSSSKRILNRLKSAWASIIKPMKIKRARDRHRPQIDSLVLPVVENLIRTDEGESLKKRFPSLILGFCQNYPTSLQTWILDRWASLWDALSSACDTVRMRAAEVRGNLIMKLTSLKEVSSKREADLIEVQARLNKDHMEEISEEELISRFESERRYDQTQARREGLKASVLIPGVLAIVLSIGEAGIAYSSLEPLFFGVTGLASWLLPMQVILITSVMVFSAHYLTAQGKPWQRVLSGGSLAMFSLGLSVIRFGAITYKSGSVSTSHLAMSPESIAMNALFWGASVGFALMGAMAFRRAMQNLKKYRSYEREHADQIAGMDAHRTARMVMEEEKPKQEAQCLSQLKRREAELQVEIQRIHSEILSTEKALEKLYRVQIQSAMGLLRPELENISEQFARWAHLDS